MPTNTHVDELKINELTEAQYDAAVANGTIGANEISVLTDASDVGALPTTGGTITGSVEIVKTDASNNVAALTLSPTTDRKIKFTPVNATTELRVDFISPGDYAIGSLYIAPGYIYSTGASFYVGTVNRVCDIVYTKKIASSGNTINVPTTGGTMALTSDIPTIATSVDATSTDNETVSAKLFYDTIGDIETLINAL